MSNYAVWNNRLRHEWLAKPQKAKYMSKRDRERCGLQEAIDRKAGSTGEGQAEGSATS
jgi:hypothetical protein